MEYRSAFARRYYAEGFATGFAEGFAEGLVKGLTEAIIEVLEVRGLTVPEEVSERILSCHDHRTLHTWLRRAVTVATINDLLE
ncbi:hypothetical protein AB0K60_01680 [Thermopolyspora sp. NPDC052614]|uniref:hypothetical protein n=1 Tax=Thermopolyspora sp. NPDC052614 TaxID=3155682 RepID=UPI00343B5813